MSKHRTRGTWWSRLLSGVLCLALVAGLLPAAGLIQPAEAAYWADPYGEQLVEWGVMNPSSDLRLSSTITRAEFVAMCNRAFGYSRLGSIPFVDVPSSAWYAQDINIAYNAGYFKGTTSDPEYPTASPNGTLTREQAAVLIARNLMLQETVGEVQDFTDSHDLSEWSRGLIGAAVAEGMIGGYEDGSYRPTKSITRGEVAKMLVSVIGTPISKPGSYELGSVYGNVMISSSNVTLRDTVILGNLYVTGGVDLGNVLLENVTVLGRIVVSGGGESHAGQSSVVLRNVAADELVIDSIIDQFVTVSAYGITDIPVTHVRSDAYLEDDSSAGYGLRYIEFDADPGSLLQLAGSIKEVVNTTPFSTLQLAQGTAEKITIDEYATNSELILDINTRVDELNLDVATLVYGKGDITNLNINASDCEVEILPEHVTIRPGITATVAGEPVDSNGAAELSSEPRLLAGYPKVANLTPTQAEGQFSGNKQGTIYYAVSELSDGSVSEEDLVNNPAYGGIIYEGNAGNIAAASKTVYSRDITELEPDGSYYLTAMLEDGRGNRSPIKVVSFTTPDNTVPEFLNGYISLATCETVQLTGTPNKSCQLYWVLLADGAAAPTPQNFKSGSFGGSYGSGTMSVTKNVPVSITVNTQRLQEDTDYDLYVWLNDFDGVHSSRVYKFDVHTPDETPPVVTNIMQTDFGESDAEVTFAINEAPSTLYWAVVTESNQTFITPDTALDSLRAQVKVESGATSIVHGSTNASGAGVDTAILKSVLKGLDYETYKTHSFKMYYVAKDAAGNYSEVGILYIHTLDTDPPTAWLDFTDYVGEDPKRPRASSDIMIVFSEQVKGGASATQTFLDLYKQVEDAPSENKDAAKTMLATELARHIELYYIPTTGRPQQVSAAPTVGDGSEDWIDFRNAIVELRSDGCLVITLPGEDRPADGIEQAINLRSGVTYQFQIKGVFDDAFTPNGMAGDHGEGVADTSGNFVTGLYFTTVYAQVELYENADILNITSSDDDLNNIRLDMVVDVTPQSTSNMADTEFWDMIIWSNIGVKFDVYRSTDNNNDWEKVGSDITILAPNQPASRLITDGTYTTVKSSLLQGHTYHYGIHFTEVGGTPEGADNKTTAPTSWSDLVVMKFSLVAGSQGYLNNLSGNVDVNYTDLVYTRELLSEIGVVYTKTGTESILTIEKQFTDTRAPQFASGSPTFTSGSGSITMTVDLGNRPGKVYYVAAPSDGTITTTFTNANDVTITLNKDNDGSQYEDKIADNIGSVSRGYYIPQDGTERDSAPYKNKIFFVNGVNGVESLRYTTPTYDRIFNGASYYRNDTENIKVGTVTYTSSRKTETITGLKPETWYYVYMVLQSDSGTLDEIVQIYRVKTTKAQPPSITVSHSGTADVLMTVYDTENPGTLYDNTELYYALAEWNRLPSWFFVRYTWENGGKVSEATSSTGNIMTILEAMISTVPNDRTNRTYFDVFADQLDESVGDLKDQVKNYITRATTDNTTGYVPTYFDPVNENRKLQECGNYMTADNAEYVMLVCARNRYADDIGTSYGFSASRGLYKPDDVPPEFIGTMPVYEPSFSAVMSGNQNIISQPTWRNTSTRDYSFNGSITLIFSKEIYTYQTDGSGNIVRKQIVGKNTINSETEVSILTVLGSSVPLSLERESTDQKTFVLRFTGLKNGNLITLNNLYNGSGTPSNKTLRMEFRAAMTLRERNVLEGIEEGFIDEMYYPAFVVTWQ